MKPLGVLLLASLAVAQEQDFGRDYAFQERKPRSAVERTIDKLLPSIVKVHGASGLRSITGYASGVVVSEQGHVLTLDQILLQPERTKVVLHDGAVFEATLLPPDEKSGVRLLKIDPGQRKLVPVVPAAGEPPRNGTFVVSLGNSFRLAEFSEKVSATFGVITAKVRTGLRYLMSDADYAGELLVTDAPNNPGQYGGGLFTLDGRWIGLNTRIVESTETNTQISAAIPVRDFADYLERALSGKPLLVGDASPDDAAAPARPPYSGLVLFDQGGRRSPPAYVERVEAGSPAAAAGLKPDDLIVRVDETPVRTCGELKKELESRKPGAKLELTWKRGTTVLKGELTLAEAR